MENQRRRHDDQPAGMGGTYQGWLRYQEKEERRLLRLEKENQTQRSARYRVRAAKAAKTRRKRSHARQRTSALQGILVDGVALTLVVAGNVVKQVWRAWR